MARRKRCSVLTSRPGKEKLRPIPQRGTEPERSGKGRACRRGGTRAVPPQGRSGLAGGGHRAALAAVVLAPAMHAAHRSLAGAHPRTMREEGCLLGIAEGAVERFETGQHIVERG